MSDRELTDADVAHAIELAAQLHGAQLDRQGMLYLWHVLRVGAAGTSNEERVVGLLHDTIEDTSFTLIGVRQRFGDAIADAVDALTRREDEIYQNYIRRLSTKPLARAVKIHDLRDNLRRANQLPASDGSRLSVRYLRALEILGALDEDSPAPPGHPK